MWRDEALLKTHRTQNSWDLTPKEPAVFLPATASPTTTGEHALLYFYKHLFHTASAKPLHFNPIPHKIPFEYLRAKPDPIWCYIHLHFLLQHPDNAVTRTGQPESIKMDRYFWHWQKASAPPSSQYSPKAAKMSLLYYTSTFIIHRTDQCGFNPFCFAIRSNSGRVAIRAAGVYQLPPGPSSFPIIIKQQAFLPLGGV